MNKTFNKSKMPVVTFFEEDYYLVACYSTHMHLIDMDKEVWIDEGGTLRNSEEDQYGLCGFWTEEESIKADNLDGALEYLDSINKVSGRKVVVKDMQISLFDLIA